MRIDRIDDFLPYFARIRERTMRVGRAVPPERMEWRPAPGRFSPGDLLRHIAATERCMWAENVHGRPSRYPGHGLELQKGEEGVLDYVARQHAEAVELFSRLTPDDLRAPCPTPGGVELPTWKWLRAMVEHEVHHRGQIYVLLGSIGAPAPPLYGLTEPEVLARSRP